MASASHRAFSEYFAVATAHGQSSSVASSASRIRLQVMTGATADLYSSSNVPDFVADCAFVVLSKFNRLKCYHTSSSRSLIIEIPTFTYHSYPMRFCHSLRWVWCLQLLAAAGAAADAATDDSCKVAQIYY